MMRQWLVRQQFKQVPNRLYVYVSLGVDFNVECVLDSHLQLEEVDAVANEQGKLGIQVQGSVRPPYLCDY